MKIIRACLTWLLSVFIIPFVAFYKALKAGIIHIFNEVDRLFSFLITKERKVYMTIADDIAMIKADVEALKAAPVPVATVDLSPVETAVAAVKGDTAAILAELTPTPKA